MAEQVLELLSWSIVVAVLAASGLNFTSSTTGFECLSGEGRVLLAGTRAVAMMHSGIYAPECFNMMSTLPRNDSANLNHNVGLPTFFFNPKRAKVIRLKVQVRLYFSNVLTHEGFQRLHSCPSPERNNH